VGAADSPLADVCARARGVHIDVGRGRTSSRTALWSLLTPVVLAAHELGLIEAGESVLSDTADRLDLHAEACRPTSESFVNPGKILAIQLGETIPVVLGDGPLNGVAAARAASMLARTARIPATSGELPDAASQIVACFDGPFTAGGGRGVGVRESASDIFADPFLDGPAQPRLGLLMLRDAPPTTLTPERTDAEALTDAVLQTAYDAGVRVATVVAEPGHPLVRLAGQIAQTDFAATYLAIGLGLDPAVSPHVADLRDRTRG
jgi:glucose/mannose-6-phosphate isomerase